MAYQDGSRVADKIVEIASAIQETKAQLQALLEKKCSLQPNNWPSTNVNLKVSPIDSMAS